MAEKKQTQPLFGEFLPSVRKDWEELATKDLKGADFSKLVWKTSAGFEVNPYYTSEDMGKLDYLDVEPGCFPYIRGNRAGSNTWHIRQNIAVGDIAASNRKALDVLMKGVTSMEFILERTLNTEELERLCENIYAEAVELNFSGVFEPLPIMHSIAFLAKKFNRNLSKISGSVGYHPLADISMNGCCDDGVEAGFDMAAALVSSASLFPAFRVIRVNGDLFRNSGAGLVEEIAFSLAQATNYLTNLTERGIPVSEIAPRIEFRFANGPEYFLEIAKLRAARLLWAAIVKAYGPCDIQSASMYIHCISSRWNKTIYDPNVNLLRTTTEAMAAITGGADALTVLPYNVASGIADPNAERLARNQQLLLKEESYLDKVIDPAGGSYYIENLTDLIAETAWKLFLEVHENGGYAEACKSGFIGRKINEKAEARNKAVASRKEVLVGTNQYPDFTGHLTKQQLDSLSKEMPAFNPDHAIDRIMPHRGATAFEKLRIATDRWALKNKRPRVFTLSVGNLAMRRARSQFACNFFACAGFEVVDNTGFESVEEAVAACLEDKADIAVLCSSDEEYGMYAKPFADALAEKTILVVAGNPGLLPEKAKPEGVKAFIHIRSNLLESLQMFHKYLGIE